MVKVVNFVLCVFYHSFNKNSARSLEGLWWGGWGCQGLEEGRGEVQGWLRQERVISPELRRVLAWPVSA